MTLPITVLIAAKNEERNLPRCLAALQGQVERVIVIDSQSTDATAKLARAAGAEVLQFQYRGGYPKKRQWALDHLDIGTEWILLLDADEVVPPELWQEIGLELARPVTPSAFLIRKGFHFLGRRFRFGGFSFSAVMLFRRGKARFEQLVWEDDHGLDMEVHERLIVSGSIFRLRTALIHQDFKNLEAYLDRHNRYSTWEARLRIHYLCTGEYGSQRIPANCFGTAPECRRWLKMLVIRLPGEHLLWFLYHFVFCLGFLEGRRGFIACRIRAQYIANVRAKMYEFELHHSPQD